MTDYTIPTLDFHLESTRMLHDIIFDQMERESDFMFSCLENMQIIMEAEVNNAAEKKNFFQKIIEFIKKIFKMFTDKTKAMVESNKKWMEVNFPKIEKLNFDGLEIEMLPYWAMDLGKVKSEANKIMSKIVNEARRADVTKYKDMEAVKTDMFSAYVDKDKNLAAGFKNLFRVGNAQGAKPVLLRGNDLKSKIKGDFRKYCNTYESAVIPAVKQLIDQAERNLEQVTSTLSSKKETTTESFCLLENAFYEETELAYCENFIVLEAEQPAKEPEKKPEPKKEEKPQGNSSDDKPKPTKVELKDHGSNQNAKQTDKTQKKLDKLSSDELIVAKNIAQVSQIAISSIMTVMEERFHVYINAMKQIVSARGKTAEPEEKK